MSAALIALLNVTAAGYFLRFFSSILLAKWLAPESFALIGVIGAIIFSFEMFTDGGFKGFILRHSNGDNQYCLATVWTVRLIRGVVLFLSVFLSSDFIASFFEIENLSLALRIASLAILIRAFEPISFYSAERSGLVAKILKIEFLIQFIVFLCNIVGVYLTKSYWVIIFSGLINPILRLVFCYFLFGLKGSSFSLHRDYIIELFHWVKYIIPSSIITLLLAQLDKLILGKFLSLNELGLYFIALNFSSAAMNFIGNYSRRVLLVEMAEVYRLNGRDFKSTLYLNKTNILCALSFGIGLGMGCADVFFDILYDDRYQKAANYLTLLLIVPAMSLFTQPGTASLIILGKVKMTLTANVLRIVWLIPALWIGVLYFHSVGVIFAISLIELFPFIFILYKLKSLKILDFKKEVFIGACLVIGLLLSALIKQTYERVFL